ncbi:MAG: CapA family protein [Anaerolineae bacterium]
MRRNILLLWLVLALLAGCAQSVAAPTTNTPAASVAEPTLAETVAPPPTETPAPPPTETPMLPTPTPALPTVWFDPAVPDAVQDMVTVALNVRALALADSPEQAVLRVGPNLGEALARWVYAAVVPFPTLTDEIAWGDVQAFWAGDPSALTAISGDAVPPTLFVTEDVLAVLEGLLGAPAASAPIQVVQAEEALDVAWAARPHAWSVVAFDALAPRWKVLRVDGASVLDKAMDVASYPLAHSLGVEGEASAALVDVFAPGGKLTTNRDTDKMTVLVMTGVTALVRATAHEMEQRGVLYPAEQIVDILRGADLTHISNEIPFASNCPPPNRNSESLVFCSDPKYIELLQHVGTDLIELTGNHFQDYGSDATLDTLAMYREEGWPHYGGGADLEDARKPLRVESNGNSFSFIGCNPVGPTYAWATENAPGAAPCDFEYMHDQLTVLNQEVDVPIATWQYWEFYHFEPTPQQQEDFRGMVDAGARIVSGSQAHHPQAIEFYRDGFIHYGLGNLFFDQMWSLGTRQEMADRHVIYDGRHISTELLTFMLENFAQPRPMTTVERNELLTSIFAASGW